jgi:hypothetical protein
MQNLNTYWYGKSEYIANIDMVATHTPPISNLNSVDRSCQDEKFGFLVEATVNNLISRA